jgi:bacterioferritin-associated ferredoxin
MMEVKKSLHHSSTMPSNVHFCFFPALDNETSAHALITGSAFLNLITSRLVTLAQVKRFIGSGSQCGSRFCAHNRFRISEPYQLQTGYRYLSTGKRFIGSGSKIRIQLTGILCS